MNAVSGTQEALAAAAVFDAAEVDSLELFFRNAYGIWPSVPAAILADKTKKGMSLLATELNRGAGPDGRSLITWAWVFPCPVCWRRPSKIHECKTCVGDRHIMVEGWPDCDYLFADLDGNIHEVRK